MDEVIATSRPLFSRSIVLLCFLLVFAGCTSSRLVQPLHQGKAQINVAAGGPFFDYKGTTIPMPLTSVGAAYGIDQDLSLFAGLHTTSLYYGLGHGDIGVVKGLRQPEYWSPGISVAPAVSFMLDGWDWNFRAYPSVDINLYWQAFESRDFFYVGSTSWFEPATRRAHKEKQPYNWIPSIHSGYTLISGSFSYNAEVKYLAPFYSNKNIVVEYLSPVDRGAIGLYIAVGYTF